MVWPAVGTCLAAHVERSGIALELDQKETLVTRLKRKIAVAFAATLAALGLSVVVRAGNASAATANPNMSIVPCDSSDYLQVWWHQGNDSPRSEYTCFANAGTWTFSCFGGCWLDAFSTGNNVVQYEADGNWQPSTPVGKYTYFDFPNHAGGVDLDGMKIF